MRPASQLYPVERIRDVSETTGKEMMPSEIQRLTFRHWNEDDLDRLHAICSNSQVMQFVGEGQIWSRERVREFIQFTQETLERHGYCQWAVIHKAHQIPIGFCGFANSDAGPEVGWRLASEYWGQGLATEAAQAALKYAFERLEFQRVIANVQAENIASIRVMEKLGMRPVKRYERANRKIVLYSVNMNEH